jgi:hypothetical protein
MHIFMVEQIVIKTNNFENDYLINYHVFFMFLSYLYVLSCIDFATFYYFSGTKTTNTTLSEQKQQIPHCPNKNNKYHIVRTKTTNTTLSEQKQQIPHCRNKNNKYHIVGTKTTNTTLSEQFLNSVLTMWYLLFLFGQCGICCFCSDNVVFVVFVPTMWYLF